MMVTILKLGRYNLAFGILCSLIVTVVVSTVGQSAIQEKRKASDRQVLSQLLDGFDFDNDLLEDTVIIPANSDHQGWVNLELLGLRKDRLAYLVKKADEVVNVVVPVTADDGFNGDVDLLVAIDMYGRIQATSVIRPFTGTELYGVLDIIESQWLKLFAGNTFRDIQRLSWQTIAADNEYDLFVGASVTPKTVSAKIYDALIFYQSNRIAFLQGGFDDV